MSLFFLDDKKFSDQEFGNKAVNLHHLAKVGFSVPQGFCSLISANERELHLAVDRIGGFPVAVRSSAQLEDLPGHSFAGQYTTILNVQNLNELQQALVTVENSYRNSGVQAYLAQRNIQHLGKPVSAFVQKMVNAKLAGVAFSLNPISGKEEESLIEFCFGLGERLVSGHHTPSRLVLDVQGNTLQVSINEEGARLSPEQIQELVLALQNISAHFGSPQDVEFAFDQQDKLWILQSRPITTIFWRQDIDEFTDADFRDGGVSARPCTALMYSLYERVMQSSMQSYFQKIRLLSHAAEQKTWISQFYGRPYWNMTAVKTLLEQIPGYDEKEFDENLGIQKDYGPQGPRSQGWGILSTLKVIPTAICLFKEFKGNQDRVKNFGSPFLAQEAGLLRRLDTISLTEDELKQLTLDVFELHFKTESLYFETIYNSTNFQSEFRKKLKAIAPNGLSFLLDLMSGVGEISHLKSQSALVQLHKVAVRHGMKSTEFSKARADFLQEHYYHSDAALDLLTPRWWEVPDKITLWVEKLVREPGALRNPEDSFLGQQVRFHQTLDDIRKNCSAISWRAFKKSLDTSRLFLRNREEMRDYSTRCYNLIRKLMLVWSELLSFEEKILDPQLVFHASVYAWTQFARGTISWDDMEKQMKMGQQGYLQFRNFSPPHELGMRKASAVSLDVSLSSTDLRGTACSPGQIKGTVFVAQCIADVQKMRPGSILVTKFTDPGWTSALAVAGAVITEVGGVLSHAAVISREYGIPAVLNVSQATFLLKTGDFIEVDGSQGRITVLDGRSAL
jgi:phosphohistidine swiveling domain-containing protein